MPEFLCALAIILLAVMVIGHGMWLVCAWFFRAVSGSADAVPPRSTPPVRLTLRDELATTIQHIERLTRRGAISQAQCDELVALLNAELNELSAPLAGTKLVPEARERTVQATLPGPGLVPAISRPEIVDAILVDAPTSPPPPPVPVSIHPLDRPSVPAPPISRRQPGRPFADVLQSFMEESNIRWGEILAAMLVVLCSVGLVISLRSTLKEIPYFPAILFTLFTVSFHGAGLYTLRRWKLQAVSRVILIISLLLVPLTFCGAIALQQDGPTSLPLFVLAIAVGTAVFTWVSYSASRELIGSGAWPLAVGVVGPSLAQVLVQHFDFAGGDIWRLNLVLSAPIACFLTATGWQLARAARHEQLSRPRVIEILRVLGIAGFALLVLVALLIVRAGATLTIVARTSPLLSVAAAAALAIGLLIHRRTTARRLTAWQTAGTAILVLAALVMLLLVAVAWPEPELLLTVGLINCVILAVLGVVAELPLLFVPSFACAALSATIGLHLVCGHFADRTQLAQKIVQAGLMGRTSLVLTALAGLAAGLGAWNSARKEANHAFMLVASAGGLALLAFVVTLFSGFVIVAGWKQDRDLAAGILLTLAAACVAASPFVRRPEPAAIGSALFWLALVQAFAFNTTIRSSLAGIDWLIERPVLAATLLHGVLTAFAALVAVGRRTLASSADFRATSSALHQKFLAEPLAIGAAISLAAAVPFIAWVRGDQFSNSAAMALAATAGWAMLAAAQRWPWAISCTQAMAFLVPAIYIAGIWKGRYGEADWFVRDEHLYAQVIALALVTIVWNAVRRWSSHKSVARELFCPPWPAVDQVLLGLASLALPVLALWFAAPHVGWELGMARAPALEAAVITDVFGPHSRGWIALAGVLATLAVSLWERVSYPALVGVGCASFAAVWLAAGPFESTASAASAARWAAAIYAVVWAALYIGRELLRLAARQITTLRWDHIPGDTKTWFCAQPLALGGATILVLTILAVQQQATGVTLNGPIVGTFFEQLGPTVSYATPLTAIVVVLLAYALRERQAGFALGGAAIAQFAVNLAYLLHVDPAAPATFRAIEWLQWNSIAAGAYSLAWLALSRWITPADASDRQRRLADALWFVPVATAGAAAALLVAWAAVVVIEHPGGAPLELALFGSWQSYLAVGLVLAAVLARTRGRLDFRYLGDAVTWLVAGFIPLIAASVHWFDTSGLWLSYHVLEAGWLVVAAVACGIVVWQRSKSAEQRLVPHHVSVAALTALVVFLAIRGNYGDPGQPWWSLAASAGACAISTALGLTRRSQPYAYASTALAALTAILLLAAPFFSPILTLLFQSLADPARFELLTLSIIAAAAFWLSREIASQQRYDQSFDSRTRIPRIHAIVAFLGVPLYGWYRLTEVMWYFPPVPAFEIVATITTLALGGLLFLTLWDRRGFFALPLAYVWLGAVWLLVFRFARPWLVTPEHGAAALLLAAAAHIALTGQIWSYGANLAALGSRWGISDPVAGLARTEKWLPALNLMVTPLLCLASLMFVLTFSHISNRVAVAFIPAIAAWGVLCLAQERRRDALQLAALLLAGLSAVFLAWAQIEPRETAAWMTRVFRLLMVLGVLTFAYGLVLPRFLLTAGSWNAATRKAGYIAGAAALVAFAFTLALEVQLYLVERQAAIDGVQVGAIAVVLLALIAGLLSLAVLPGRDPLLLSEKNRQIYVYAAEATAALLFAHIYVCRPEWFGGIFTQYWPFIVMAIAFLGLGAAEIFERRGIRVLSEPLTRTGAMLPLLPVIGWWVAGPSVDYSLLLLVTGILYLALSYTRKSWAAMIAATLAGNGALWALLSDTNLSFVNNPQLWLIPPALSVLLAAQLNRRRLAPEALAAIRYAATIVIYVSSTSEIFTRATSGLLPPMILLGLAVAGAILGIALRVRAFLFLGMSFTLVALLAMIRHAAQSLGEIWPWFAFGIALGVAVLVLLGLFEKKRSEVTLLIARLRQWEQ